MSDPSKDAAAIQVTVDQKVATATSVKPAGDAPAPAGTAVTSKVEEVKVDADIVEAKEDLGDLYKQCILFPTYASWSSHDPDSEGSSGEWQVRIRGWIFGFPKKSNRQRLLLGVTRLVTGIKRTDARYAQLEKRSQLFFAVDTPNSPIKIQIIGLTSPDKFELDGDPQDRIQYAKGLGRTESGRKVEKKDNDDDDDDDDDDKLPEPPRPPTPTGAPFIETASADGHLSASIGISGALVHEWHQKEAESKQNRLLKLRAFFSDHPESPTYGVVNLIEPYGVSVVSDIDDTIKNTGILLGAKTVVGNTFLHNTQDIPGMADTYYEWWRKGVNFHYVSNSPWELYPMVENFFREHRFPPGTAHLKMYKGVSAVVKDAPGQSKQDRITEIIKDFPNRRFVLIGDTGEKDPEVYSEIARRFPDRIISIFIHDVTTPILLQKAEDDIEAALEKKEREEKEAKAEGKSREVGAKDKEDDSTGIRDRIRGSFSKLRDQLHSEDRHDVDKAKQVLDNVLDAAGEVKENMVDLVESSSKEFKEFKERIQKVFQDISNWELFAHPKELLSYQRLNEELDKKYPRSVL